MKKRFLCLLLILVMTLSLLPTAVLAEDGSSENKTFATLEKGKTYYFDLSGVGIPKPDSGYNDKLPDTSLRYVPFTYAGILAGSVGPRRMFRMPRCRSVSKIATAFCSYHERTIESGSSLTPHPNALARARAI